MTSPAACGVLAVAAGVAGYLLFWTPWLGCTLAYLAPLLGCAGLVLALRARRAEGGKRGLRRSGTRVGGRGLARTAGVAPSALRSMRQSVGSVKTKQDFAPCVF